MQTQEMDAEEQAILEAFKGPRLEYIDAQDRYIELVRDRRLDDALFLLILEMPNKRNAYHAALKNLVDVQNKLMNQSVEAASQSVTNMYWVIGCSHDDCFIGGNYFVAVDYSQHYPPDCRCCACGRCGGRGQVDAKHPGGGQSETARLLLSLAAKCKPVWCKGAGAPRLGRHCLGQCANFAKQPGICRPALSTRPAPCSKPRPPWSSCTPPCAKTLSVLSRPTSCKSPPGSHPGAAMESAVRSMGETQTSAGRIGDIIGVIDVIAFQPIFLR